MKSPKLPYQNPVKVIRAKCFECCGFQKAEIELCGIKDCALHEWRFGKNPYRKKITRPDLIGKKINTKGE